MDAPTFAHPRLETDAPHSLVVSHHARKDAGYAGIHMPHCELPGRKPVTLTGKLWDDQHPHVRSTVWLIDIGRYRTCEVLNRFARHVPGHAIRENIPEQLAILVVNLAVAFDAEVVMIFVALFAVLHVLLVIQSVLQDRDDLRIVWIRWFQRH